MNKPKSIHYRHPEHIYAISLKGLYLFLKGGHFPEPTMQKREIHINMYSKRLFDCQFYCYLVAFKIDRKKYQFRSHFANSFCLFLIRSTNVLIICFNYILKNGHDDMEVPWNKLSYIWKVFKVKWRPLPLSFIPSLRQQRETNTTTCKQTKFEL